MQKVDLESEWPSDRRARITAVAVITVGVAFLCLPRLSGWTLEHVHKEDGLIFLSDYLRDGWGALFSTYTGYLHVGPRIVAGMCAGGLPADSFANCVGVSTAVFRGLIASVAFAVFAPYTKTWKWALGAAAVLLFLGVGQHEVLGNITNMRWFTDVAAVIVLLGNFKKPAFAVGVSVLAMVAAWSDPLAIILVPIALWRAVALKGWGRAVPVSYLFAAAVHYALLVQSARTAHWDDLLNDPAGFFTQALVRGPIEAILGQNGTQVALDMVGPQLILGGLILPVVLVMLTIRVAPASLLMPAIMATLGMALVCATLLFAPLDVIALTAEGSVGMASRYALLPATLIAAALILIIPHVLAHGSFGRVVGWGTVSLMLVAAAADFTGDAWHARGPKWKQTVAETRVHCGSDHQGTISVAVTPQGVPKQWTADLRCDWVRK